MKSLQRFFGKHGDLALVIGVVGILLILFAPIPGFLLDLLLIVNLSLGLTILLLTFYVARPVDFSTFPSLLLVATLFRLSLNVAATRLILSSGSAGEVIGAIGTFAVQGNPVIGLVVFFILVVVQYVVVTNGAQRVSEVAARFVLDGMPGQQMSIDADLNMGLIDQDEARRRRKDVEREAAFYGAMDGASKFVKGDAIAGIIILLIDILGGWLVGVAQLNMPWGQALQTFTLLTIGDGIVTQVPALVISVATGIIVTRSSADRQLSAEVLRQLVLFPKIQLIVMLAITALLVLPGMPKWPILIIAPVTGALWLAARQRAATAVSAEQSATPEGAVTANPQAEFAIEIQLGRTLSAAWIPLKDSLSDKVSALRAQFAQDLGVVVPALTFRDSQRLSPGGYEILLHGARIGQGTLHADKTLAIRASAITEDLPGIAARDPAFGLPSVWIDASQIDKARSLGFTPVDPLTVLMTHLTELLRAHATQLISRAELVKSLESARLRQPGLLEELVPNLLSVSDIQRVLQTLVSESVSVKNLDAVIEALVDVARQQKDPLLVTELVRQRIGHTICHALRGNHDALAVCTLEPSLEASIISNVRGSDGSNPHIIDPRTGERLLARLITLCEAMMRQNLTPVLLTSPEVRRHLKTYTRRTVPRLAVIATSEVPATIDLKSFGVVDLRQSQAQSELKEAA